VRILLTVRPDEGEPYELTADSRDLIAWEDAKPGRKSPDLLTGNYTMKDLTEVAWRAARRDGRPDTGSLKEFIAAHGVESGHALTREAAIKAAAEADQDEAEEEDEASDPTRTGR
jgi:hypothetical protein